MDEGSTPGLYSTIESNQNDDSFNDSRTINFNRVDYQQLHISRLLVITSFPVIIVFGTFGNVLTFIVMQRGSLKHSSTCFYMAMLAVADTCKCTIFNEILLKTRMHSSRLRTVRLVGG